MALVRRTSPHYEPGNHPLEVLHTMLLWQYQGVILIRFKFHAPPSANDCLRDVRRPHMHKLPKEYMPCATLQNEFESMIDVECPVQWSVQEIAYVA